MFLWAPWMLEGDRSFVDNWTHLLKVLQQLLHRVEHR